MSKRRLEGPAKSGNARLDAASRGGSPLAGCRHVHPALDLPPDGVLAVEEAGIVEADEDVLVGLGVRAIEVVPRTRLAAELGLEVREVGPLVPVPVGLLPCAMKPGITRWNGTLSEKPLLASSVMRWTWPGAGRAGA